MSRLNQGSDPASVMKFVPATRRLKDLVLPREIEVRIRSFLREWGFADLLAKYELQPASAVLLYGPSGNGKTALAEALAGELGLPFGIVQQSQLVGIYKGETAKTLASLFVELDQQERVVCFDECDFLISARSEAVNHSRPGGGASREANCIVNEFLMQMDRRKNRSILIFTTNLRNSLDPAAARRIPLQLEIPLPTAEALQRLTALLLRKWPFLEQRREWWSQPASSFAEHEENLRNAARRMIVEGLVTS